PGARLRAGRGAGTARAAPLRHPPGEPDPPEPLQRRAAAGPGPRRARGVSASAARTVTAPPTRAVGWAHGISDPARRLRPRSGAGPLPAPLADGPPGGPARALARPALAPARRARGRRGRHVLRAPARGGGGPARGGP